MRVVYSIRTRKELREEMEKYKDSVDWNREIENFVEEKLRELK